MNKQSISYWINSIVELCRPNNVHYCTGTEEENQLLLDYMVEDGMLIKLNDELRPNSYLARSDPTDVARLENRTFICTKNKEDVGPTNNWRNPDIIKSELFSLMKGCMENKTMYIIPFVMGRLGDKYSIYGIEITDSAYVVTNMRIMTEIGTKVWDFINGNDVTLIKCLHSVGCKHDGKIGTDGTILSLKWPSNKIKYIAHFPESLEVISYGSGYGGNSLLGKKSVALRIASYIGHKEGWLAEHMFLIGLIGPNNDKKYITGAFPSAAGKTNLALIKSALPNWKVTTLGDDITWLRVDNDGKVYGMNPEKGFFGVAPNTSWKTNPHCMETIRNNTIFTNVGLTPNGDIWWEGLSDEPPEGLIDWKGKLYTGRTSAAHPNARFTVSIQNCPLKDTNSSLWVPISAILLGGKRKDVVPLVREALSWEHGVYMGSTIASETTAAAEGKVGNLRYDPFAMLPFCGYNMGRYFQHWVNISNNKELLPKIFYVNWFRKDENGNFLWPGFSQNIRVLEWIYNRVSNKSYPAISTPVGYIPETLNIEGTDNVDINAAINIDKAQWIQQMQLDKIYLESLGSHVPKELFIENNRMSDELSKMRNTK